MTTNKYYSAEMANLISKNITEYKYAIEGTGRTHGSYVMTHWKSLVGHINNDMNMEQYFIELNKQFGKKQYYSGMSVGVIIGSLATATTIAALAVYMNHKNIKNNKKSNTLYETFYFESATDAAEIRDALSDVVNMYGFATIKDLYDICREHLGIDVCPPDDSSDYGWTDDINNAVIVNTHQGYIIDLPKPKRQSLRNISRYH